jgi:ParB family transcriptional regulator, chromosome partitioning protein
MATNVRNLDIAPKEVTYAVRQIKIERIRAFAFQPRKWFDAEEISARAQSMKALGQQDPVTVEPAFGDPEHDFELINGESRLRSAREAGIKTLWAAVRSVPFPSRVEKHLASLVANFNRSDHTPMEISDALHVQVTEGGKNQADISRALGKNPMWVGHYLSLQKLHPKLQALMHPSRPRAERLAPATAFELARLPVDRQLEILNSSRGADGKVTVVRVKIRAAVKFGERVEPQTWTAARERKYQEFNRPDPTHVARLSAGIAEFRSILEARRK